VMTLVEAINHTLHQEMERDGRVLVFGQDVARNGGVFRATDGLLGRFGGQRVVDTPLSEGVIIGTSVGLAAGGMVPVAEIQFLGFSWQAFHQIAGQLARLRYRSDGRFDCPVTVRAPFGGGVRTPELHSEALEAQLVQCPGLKVVLPASAADAKGLLASAIRDPDPVMFLEPLKGYRLVKDEVPEGARRARPVPGCRRRPPGLRRGLAPWPGSSSHSPTSARASRRARSSRGWSPRATPSLGTSRWWRCRPTRRWSSCRRPSPGRSSPWPSPPATSSRSVRSWSSSRTPRPEGRPRRRRRR